MEPKDFDTWLRSSLPDGWTGEFSELPTGFQIQLTHPRMPPQVIGPKRRLVAADRQLVIGRLADAAQAYRREEFDLTFADEWPDGVGFSNPFVWLVRLKLKVTGILTGPAEHSIVFEFDRAAAAVRADELIEQGLETGTAFATVLVDGAAALAFDFEGDCCSETWLADVVNPQALFGEYVTEAREVDLPEHLQAPLRWDGEPRTRQDEDEVYGWEVRSGKGVCTVAVRNSSNGYYGGSVEFGGFLRSYELTDLRRITADWSA